jgi:hypothetical protein
VRTAVTRLRLMVLRNAAGCDTVEAAFYNGGCYQSTIVIKISGPKTLHLKSIKDKPFIITNLLVIVIHYKQFQYIFSHFGP